ncbi:UDP-glucosyltransferase 2-like [Eupeodes corollae]|uniref:UDP-glucosyltransferase 2-like n=1 Tax=Eupeodes corollae TaxID=290404 RepID=UPI00249090D8|nr:UDP-glucosyltransferase 2-like [Eupeodes corollae]
MNIKNYLSFATFVTLLLTLTQCNAYKILAAFVFPARSHYMMHTVLIKELLNRGHEVTFITTMPMGKNLGKHYTEVLIPTYNYQKDVIGLFNIKTIFELTTLTLKDFFRMMDLLGTRTTEFALQQPNVQEILHRNDTKNVYDLLIVEQFYQEAFLALALKYDIPTISSSTLGQQTFMSEMMGVITPWSYVPHGSLALDDRMTFWERVQNSVASLYDGFFREFIYFPHQDELVQKYFSHLPMKLPTVSEMKKNVSVLLLNSYTPLTSPRPTNMGMVEVGGMHIYPPKSLPAEIKAFLDGATHGAIYFSLGSQVKSSDLPKQKLKIFLDVFAKMKQRILWKFEDDSLSNLPKNVMIKKWMPQGDILAHPNIKVFITHGGLFGNQEGVHYGVPMLGLPVCCDQYLNMNKAAKAGYAITLDFNEISRENLEYSLTELLEKPSYRNKMNQISEIFRDRPLSARDSAMYWIEYVGRHKGARHIRSAGLDLAWYQYYLLDVIGLFTLAVVGVVAAILLLLKKVLGTKKSKDKIN